LSGLKHTQKNWDLLGAADPLYGVLSHEGKRGGNWDEAEFFATGLREIEALLEEARRLNVAPQSGHALDFGCAVGRLSQALALHFDQVTGVDIAPSMLEKAQAYNKYGPRCGYVLNANPDLRLFGDASFDLVYSNIVLQHMAPEFALGYIAEFVRVLKIGGLLVFQIPEKPQHSGLRGFLKRLTPKPLLGAYRKLRYGQAAASWEIEMNGVPQARVLETLAQVRAKDVKHGAGWYWAIKEA
jgi:ubiquinone/menaquinone biosynthesis C-methylase UbiE